MSGDDTSLSADHGLMQSPPASLDTQHIQTDHTNTGPNAVTNNKQPLAQTKPIRYGRTVPKGTGCNHIVYFTLDVLEEAALTGEIEATESRSNCTGYSSNRVYSHWVDFPVII